MNNATASEAAAVSASLQLARLHRGRSAHRALAFLAAQGGRWTARGLAEALDLTPTRASHVLTVLCKCGVMRLVGTRPPVRGDGRGRPALVYEVIE